METNWTSEQKTVIDLRDCNILVSAAAGSGKTAVLVERILALLMDEKQPAEIDRMLIVTFTNAAAGEMKDRIRDRLEEKLEEESDSGMMERLQKQSALLQNAQISTIHSFCQYVIRNYFHTIDLDPDFRIADDGEQKLLQKEIVTQLLEEHYSGKTEEFLFMAECIATGRDDAVLEETILQLYQFSMSFPWPKEWLKQCIQDYQADSAEEMFGRSWVTQLMKVLQVQLEEIYHMAQKALTICQEIDGPYMYEEAIMTDLEELEKLTGEKSYQECSRALTDMKKWKTLSSKKSESVDETLRRKVQAIRDDYKKQIAKIKEQYFYAGPQKLYEHMAACRPVMEMLLNLTIEFEERYVQEKRRRNLCDFHDLEHLALEILVKREDGICKRTQTAEDLSDYYQHIMIDEYQDSNLVQEMILTSISGEPQGVQNLFMVGDVKQSIYRFRLARPELFMEKFASYSLTEGNNRRVDLHKNFRSRSQVLESVNCLFDKIMDTDLGKVAYNEAARLYTGAEFEKGPKDSLFTSEMLLLDLDEEGEEAEETARELEARMIGNRILELVGTQPVWDKEKKSYRCAEFGDIVILLRTVSGWAEDFSKILQNMGIPCYSGARSGYFSVPEVQTVLAFLKVIDNPCQDIPLAAVLCSPIGGLSPEDLAELKSSGEKKNFYQICRESEKLQGFFALLEKYRKRAVYTPIQKLLWEILDETGYLNFVSAMPAGKQRRANLEMLMEKAAAYESGSYHGLYHFVRYIENLHKYEVDFGEASAGGEESHMVRIMSIHKSKGLEFPIVFVAGMGKNMNQMDAQSAFVTHMDLGIGCDYIDPVLRIRGNTLFKNFVKMQIRNENLGEELRVLYVALTRAKEKLILAGAVDHLGKKILRWEEILDPDAKKLTFTDRIQARNYLDWIMPVWLQQYEKQNLVLKLYQISDLVDQEKERQIEYRMEEQELLCLSSHLCINEEAKKILNEQLNYCYPYKEKDSIPSKISVSELKRRHSEEDQESLLFYPDRKEQKQEETIPRFMKEETQVSGADRGTIYHKVMECLEFDRPIEQELLRMKKTGLLTEKECSVIRVEKIQRFVTSNLGKRMEAAQKKGCLFREQQFVMEISASEADEKWNDEEQILLQGIIDAYFIEDGKAVLVDYKTDFVKFQEASSLYEKYRVQLGYYKKALERLTDYPVKEEIIYSFCLDRELTGSEENGK